MNYKNGKANLRSEFGLIIIVFLIASVAALSSNSSDYNASTKLDFGLTTNATSSSYTSEIISGFEAVGTYYDTFITGRFGVLEDLTNASNYPVIATIKLNSTFGTNHSNEDLHCIANITDANSDPVNVTVKWYKNSVETLSYDYLGEASNQNFVADLGYKNTTRGENWSCGVRAYDGVGLSNWTNSSGLIILNSPPVVTLVSPSDGALVTNRTPTFNWTGFDEDNDNVISYDFNITLVPASLCTDSDQSLLNFSDDNVTISALNCFFDNGDYYVWGVRGHDNSSVGDWSYFNMNLSAVVDISMPVSSINFGVIPFLGSNNTTNNSPAPFVVQNNGNSFININISATDLWNSVANPSEYYQMKIDNVSGEEGAFNRSGSTTSFVYVPALNNTIFISRLNYLDAIDSAEADVYVKVPSNEIPTSKSSTVTFVSSFAE
jgi:hypothetical protein